MRKIWNTLLYGERKTKMYLWGIILLIVMSLACCAGFLLTFSMWWAVGIPGALIAAAVLCLTVKFRETDGVPERIPEMPVNKYAAKEARDLKEETEEETIEETEEEKKQFLQRLDKKQVKRLLYKYKAKKIHYPVLIEECESRGLTQCPAYIWRSKTQLHVMALSAKPVVFDIPLSELTRICVERAVRANPKTEYESVKDAKYIAKVFQELIPSYYIMEDENGRRTYRKNSYLAGEDIYITNISARVWMQLTQAGFSIPEEEKMERAYGTYAAEAYKLKFLCQDAVLLPEEYKIKIRILLQQMVEADISDYEFSKNTSYMVKKQLITEEYAKYYEDVRYGKNSASGK